jgi:hypothetical protein
LSRPGTVREGGKDGRRRCRWQRRIRTEGAGRSKSRSKSRSTGKIRIKIKIRSRIKEARRTGSIHSRPRAGNETALERTPANRENERRPRGSARFALICRVEGTARSPTTGSERTNDNESISRGTSTMSQNVTVLTRCFTSNFSGRKPRPCHRTSQFLTKCFQWPDTGLRNRPQRHYSSASYKNLNAFNHRDH